MNATIATNIATYVAPNLPALHRFVVPRDAMSSSIQATAQYLISTMMSFHLHHNGSAMPLHMRSFLINSLMLVEQFLAFYIKPLEPLIYDTMPFHSLYRFCWRDSCWVGTLMPPQLLASWSKGSVWVSPEVLLWIMGAMCFVCVGFRVLCIAWAIYRWCVQVVCNLLMWTVQMVYTCLLYCMVFSAFYLWQIWEISWWLGGIIALGIRWTIVYVNLVGHKFIPGWKVPPARSSG